MPYDMLTKDMLRDIFSGKKGMMKLAMVKFISVPKYDELSVKNLYDKLVQLEGMAQFFTQVHLLYTIFFARSMYKKYFQKNFQLLSTSTWKIYVQTGFKF